MAALRRSTISFGVPFGANSAYQAGNVSAAKDEVIMELDLYRGQFWAEFDAFIPGTPRFDIAGVHSSGIPALRRPS
jgi:hypothetical protein